MNKVLCINSMLINMSGTRSYFINGLSRPPAKFYHFIHKKFKAFQILPILYVSWKILPNVSAGKSWKKYKGTGKFYQIQEL